MTVYESDLPGVGKKFEIDIDDDERLVVVIHNTGKREVFRRVGDRDSVKLFEMSDRLSRQFGSILEGAYFQPIATDTTETMLDEDTLLEWIKVVEGSELAGKSLETIDLRRQTGASVVAIQREDQETESNPDPETVIETDDTLIVLGARDACEDVERLAGASGDDVVGEAEDLEDLEEGAGGPGDGGGEPGGTDGSDGAGGA